MKTKKPKTSLHIRARHVPAPDDKFPENLVDYYFDGKYIGHSYTHFDRRLMKSAGLTRFCQVNGLS